MRFRVKDEMEWALLRSDGVHQLSMSAGAQRILKAEALNAGYTFIHHLRAFINLLCQAGVGTGANEVPKCV